MPLNFKPPLLNTACAWATDLKDLRSLYECPYTGAITTRTCTLDGFKHDDSIHQYCFFGSQSHTIKACSRDEATTDSTSRYSARKPDSEPISSLNTYGYSPLPLSMYTHLITTIVTQQQQQSGSTHGALKPVIFSVTGPPIHMPEIIQQIEAAAHTIQVEHGFASFRALMEINLSCPNIAGAPPPAYAMDQLEAYLAVLMRHRAQRQRSGAKEGGTTPSIEFGLKLPPYTYQTQFDDLMDVLLRFAPETTNTAAATTTTTATTTTNLTPSLSQPSNPQMRAPTHPITFLTSTNTLGTALVLFDPEPPTTTNVHRPSPTSTSPALRSANGSGIGGMGGPALHPLALGNVRTLRSRLDAAPHASVQAIEIVGVGGISDGAGYLRMRGAGAAAVGVATALGWRGVGCFQEICPSSDAVL